MNKLLTIAALLICVSVKSQTDITNIVKHLRVDIYTLASDSMMGRNTGSTGERMASDFIINQYQKIGLTPMGDSGKFIQPFLCVLGKKYDGTNQLIINKKTFVLDENFFPLVQSANGTIAGKAQLVSTADLFDKRMNKVSASKGNIFLLQIPITAQSNPHDSSYITISDMITAAQMYGCAAIVFYNNDDSTDDLELNLNIKTPDAKVPVVFLKHTAYNKLSSTKKITATLSVNMSRETRTGHNIIAMINNNAANTIVIGAHYDHLGLGHDGNSLYSGPEAIHNGADDNASGTAGVIELARMLKYSAAKNYNYLFINFSGEELGLLGSNYWVKNATYDTSKINYMINMDMIGHYDSTKGMEIEGLGTSPAAFAFIRNINDFKIKFSDKGTGPTDHTSFYYANIPVLNFFTGTHSDYHKPTDDADKINYQAEAGILVMIEKIIDTLNNKPVLTFTQTADGNSSDAPSFKVRLGIIPDYMFEGPGLRVDGVDEGKPAANAGMQKGDVIMQLGDTEVTDIMAYMQALAKFKKGETVHAKVKRGNDLIDLNVTF